MPNSGPSKNRKGSKNLPINLKHKSKPQTTKPINTPENPHNISNRPQPSDVSNQEISTDDNESFVDAVDSKSDGNPNNSAFLDASDEKQDSSQTKTTCDVDCHDKSNLSSHSCGLDENMSNSRRCGTIPPPPMSPSSSSATDRHEEMACFVQRMRLQQQQNGVCNKESLNESGNHECPILWYVNSYWDAMYSYRILVFIRVSY